MITLYEIVVPNVMQQGFSAFISSVTASTDLQFTNWSVASPYFSSPNFDAITGIYTTPAAGRYAIDAVINYNTDSALSVSIASSINPAFEVNRTSPAATLLSGLLPLNNLSLTLVSIRAILGGGAVTLTGEVSLSIGDELGLYFNADAMTGVTLHFSNIFWAVYRIT